ncbi:cell division protein FtsQ/DivIB [Kaarinaea lacus]
MTSNAIIHQEPIMLPLPNKRVVMVMFAVALITMIALALRSKLFTPTMLHINAMQVYGELRWVDRAQLNATVKPYLDSNFFSADLNGIKRTVESLPWVASASVRRQWPNQLQILINEHKAVAKWKDDTLINEKGELFQPAEIPLDIAVSLVQLQGPDNSYQYLFAQYQELQTIFLEHDLQGELSIAKVYMNERRALGVELSNGMRIVFGRLNASMDLYNAASRFLQAFKSNIKAQVGRVAVVDLRYTNGFAVQWKTSNDKTAEN